LEIRAAGVIDAYRAIWWSRNETRIAMALQARLPADLRELIASRRASLST
jgi:hypothetical protein